MPDLCEDDEEECEDLLDELLLDEWLPLARDASTGENSTASAIIKAITIRFILSSTVNRMPSKSVYIC